MRNSSWADLINLIDGNKLSYQPVGFIIDSPWIPGWYGISTIDYYASDELWLKANLKAINTFPEIWFLPSFWSEYGMCTEPSAFGSRMIFSEDSLPHAAKVADTLETAISLPVPNVKTDGLLPFMISRLRNNQRAITEADHQVRFAVARGPMNIASFLMGTTEFMMALAMDPTGSHKLLQKITDFICNWVSWQRECFPSIDGVLILDDIIGFVGEYEFDKFVTPYFRKIYDSSGARVRFLHNDADGLITAANLKNMGVNMFNFSFSHSLAEIRELSGQEVVLVGNIPPRDVLAAGSEADVRIAVKKAFSETENHNRIVWSAGGGLPPGVSAENIRAFASEVEELSKNVKR
jgi:uroporphyrinogen-III decarboxylase